MDDKMRARTYYAAAVSLFQNPLVDDCEIAIELLNKAADLYPDFSEASIFREEVWHCLLKSLDPNNDLETYEKYLKSPAWKVKRDAVEQRDGGQCVCGAQATEVHHKTYDNIGKEPLSDLVALCEECHEKVPKPYVLSDPQSSPQQASPPGKEYWDKFETYVKENENRLQFFPEPDLPSIYGIQIDQKTLNSGDIFEDGAFWLIAYRSRNELQANLCIQSLEHYNNLKRRKDTIKGKFADNLGELKWNDGNRWIGFFDDTVGHVDRADTDQEFSWLHDKLVRLRAVFQLLVLELQEGIEL